MQHTVSSLDHLVGAGERRRLGTRVAANLGRQAIILQDRQGPVRVKSGGVATAVERRVCPLLQTSRCAAVNRRFVL